MSLRECKRIVYFITSLMFPRCSFDNFYCCRCVPLDAVICTIVVLVYSFKPTCIIVWVWYQMNVYFTWLRRMAGIVSAVLCWKIFLLRLFLGIKGYSTHFFHIIRVDIYHWNDIFRYWYLLLNHHILMNSFFEGGQNILFIKIITFE